MQILINVLVGAVAVFASAYILPGVKVDSFVTAAIVAIVLGVINAVIKPILLILTLPVTLLTMGLFTFVINAVLVLLVSNLVPGFTVANFWWALAFSIVLSLVSSFLSKVGR